MAILGTVKARLAVVAALDDMLGDADQGKPGLAGHMDRLRVVTIATQTAGMRTAGILVETVI